MRPMNVCKLLPVAFFVCFVPVNLVIAAEAPLYVGWATQDITPPKPVAISGQMHMRIGRKVNDPITCTALAVETKDNNGKSIEQAIMVCCDLVGIGGHVQDMTRAKLEGKLPGFDLHKLFLNATHTHAGPLTRETSRYQIPEDIMQPAEYVEFLTDRIAQAVKEAWQNRKPAQFSWGLSHAVVGHNRRARYQSGFSLMYGDTERFDLDTVEGYEDHAVETLFFWNEDKLLGMVINIASPSQETPKFYKISADFWHETRLELKKRFGEHIFVFPQCGPGGDQTSHLIYRQAADEEMLKRKNIHRRQEIALRIADAIEEIFPYVKKTKSQVSFKHLVDNIELPVREEGGEPYKMELHVIRLDEIAICTNPFELYLDYGIRIKARSPAILTLVTQLACDQGGYVPTRKADAGGHYSTRNTRVAPPGGDKLVEETLARINKLWQE